MNQEIVKRQLAAGGLIPLHASCDAKVTEAIVARSYTCPVLGERKIVKLSSDRLVPAEDLAMEFLGLSPVALSKPLSRQLRTSLDFAHWALVHQPKQARYALELVKRMKGAERKAAAKPGHAWDQYQEMSTELGKSVRHFLPPFWEQAARAFKNLGNVTYAGRALNKALEAERVHALEVDREHRRDVVLEFSLNGCLSGKALSDYSKDLAAQFPPREAFETYSDLLLRRTQGGMAPTATAGSDLIRLAKAAKLDVDAVVETFLESIISSPAMVRAPFQFWKSVQKQVGNLVRRSDSFGVWLLVHTNPQSSYSDDSSVWNWIDMLESWGVLPLLSRPIEQLPGDVEIPGGRAAWISRVARVETSPHKRVFELLEQMAPILIQEGQPLHLESTNRWRNYLDVDVLETCLQLKLPLSSETADCTLDFDGWLRAEVDHPRRNSQLERIATDSRFSVKLSEKVPELFSFHGDKLADRSRYSRNCAIRRSFEAAAINHPLVERLWWECLDGLLGNLERGGLHELEESAEFLGKCIREKTIQRFPELLQRMEAVDVAANLQRSLIAGVFDEYGWPALDEHADQFPVPKNDRYDRNDVDAFFPYFCYRSQNQCHVVTVDGVRTLPAIALAPGDMLQHLIPCKDDFAVVFRTTNYETMWRWLSETPDTRRNGKFWASSSTYPLAHLSTGGTFWGFRAVQPGDSHLPNTFHHWFSDGTRVWRADPPDVQRTYPQQELPLRCRERNPVTGEAIRDSIPTFFEQDLPPGAEILWRHSQWMPCPGLDDASPLGSRAGQIGWRVIRRRDGTVQGLGVDGRTLELEELPRSQGNDLYPIGLMKKPCAANEGWILNSDGSITDLVSNFEIMNTRSKTNKYRLGQPTNLSELYFHFMRLRHEPSSEKLRATTLDQATQMLNEALVEHEARKLKENPDDPDPNRVRGRHCVESWLTGAPPRMIDGVARLTQIAAEERVGLSNLTKRLRDQAAGESTANRSAVADANSVAHFNRGFLQLDLRSENAFPFVDYLFESHDQMGHIQKVAQYLSGTNVDSLPRTAFYWFGLLAEPMRVAYRCFWKTVTNEQLGTSIPERVATPWLDVLVAFADSGLLSLSQELVLYVWEIENSDSTSDSNSDFSKRIKADNPIAFAEQDSRYVAYRFKSHYQERIVVLEHPTTGKPKPPQGMMVTLKVPLPKTCTGNKLKTFANEAGKVQTIPFPNPQDVAGAAALLNLHPIAVALTYMGDLHVQQYGKDTVPKEVREFYQWKTKDIQDALAQLKSAPAPPGVASKYATLNPAEALVEKRDVALRNMALTWKNRLQPTFVLPPELAVQLEKIGHRYRSQLTSQFTAMISAPEQFELFQTRQFAIQIANKGRYRSAIEVKYVPPRAANAEEFCRFLLRSIGATNYYLPAGHELRRQLPTLIRIVRKWLDDPQTVLPFGGLDTEVAKYPPVPPDVPATLAKFTTLVGKLDPGADGIYHCDSGLIVVGVLPPNVVCLFRTAKLQSLSDLQKLQAIAAATFSYSGSCQDEIACALVTMRFRSESCDRLLSINESPTTAAGGWDQNPQQSVPPLVEIVAQKFNFSSSAATLYLQMLALPDPTAKNIQLWNQWTAKQFQAAAEELGRSNLVVCAKRARAGREIFLPGGWEALAAPNLPIETWKLPLFGYKNVDPLRGGNAELIVCGDSVAALFQQAWQRIEQGDPPRYEEAATSSNRKK